MSRHQRRALAIGPATLDQLEQWADEHDRRWARTVAIGGAVFGIGLIGLAGLALVEGVRALHSVSRVSPWEGGNPAIGGLVLGIAGALGCTLAILWLWWHGLARRDWRPLNPYRPIDVTPADLERANAAYPGALAYLDAIRHQRRPIVQHDIDMLAAIRRQQNFNQRA